jgi:hypothetical protein
MTDLSGRQLRETVHKRFRVTDAVREPIAVEQWKIVPPEINSRQPLVLMFPRPLDWALLSHTITIASKSEQSIDGHAVSAAMASSREMPASNSTEVRARGAIIRAREKSVTPILRVPCWAAATIVRAKNFTFFRGH